MHEQQYYTKNIAGQSEKDFYTNYEWCLNPIITLKEMFEHLREEIERADLLDFNWQREEARVNIYLLACAIECTIDDFIAWRPFDLMPLTRLYKRFKNVIILFQTIINFPYVLISYPKIISSFKWRKEWAVFVENVCKLILSNNEIISDGFSFLKEKFLKAIEKKLPEELLSRRMKLNEGLRCQDLTHHDIISLADKFLKTSTDKNNKYVVIGARTAGAYFAPLIKTHLEIKGFKKVSWYTVRPKKVLSRIEKKQLKKLLSKKNDVILTDDYSNTGQSFQLLQNIIWKFGALPERTTILAPIHPMKSGVIVTRSKKVKVITLHHDELFKNKYLDSPAAEKLIQNYLVNDEWSNVSLNKNIFVDLINLDFEIHYQDSFQVRLKKLFEVSLENQNNIVTKKRILCKSVGWGWLGYHAYLAGIKLKGYVPEIIGLRKGLLFSDWIEGQHVDHKEISEREIEKICSYVVKREQELAIDEDPRFDNIDIGWGWQEILSILRRAYGVRKGYLKNKMLRKQLGKIINLVPVLIDGRMNPEEWIITNNGIIKTDFEQHNFGAPELDIVDPAYDLAAASFEFKLPKYKEEKLFAGYVRETGDDTFYDRIILYKLLYATMARRKAHQEILENVSNKKPTESNFRYLYSRNFLIYTMNRFCGSILSVKTIPAFTRKYFFMDLDGVFDTEVFGFPHTTVSGLKAITLLTKNNYSIILNTGRSIEHVRSYCSSYNFKGGIAEYGSVIWDNLNMFEVPLISDDVISQLADCREILANMSDVFVDPDYRYSIRAYRFDLHRTKGLKPEETSGIIKKFKFDKLKIISREEDTYFVGKETSKGNAMHDFKNYIRYTDNSTAAIGDSDEDLPMLKTADTSFAPANCSAGIRSLAKQNNLLVTSKYRQQGLLEAVYELIGKSAIKEISQTIDRGKINSVHNLMFNLLSRAEQSPAKKIFDLINWKKL